jgi:hypothetical protein
VTLNVVRALCVAIAFGAVVPETSVAQVDEPTVDWTASWSTGTAVEPGEQGTLELSGVVQEGWHVYALTQRPGGPTALRISIDDNPVASQVGAPSGTTPESRHDPSFDLDTQFYTRSFAVHVPVTVKPGVATGGQVVPVSIRFQTCSARECRPPMTIHLSVPIEVHPAL